MMAGQTRQAPQPEGQRTESAAVSLWLTQTAVGVVVEGVVATGSLEAAGGTAQLGCLEEAEALVARKTWAW